MSTICNRQSSDLPERPMGRETAPLHDPRMKAAVGPPVTASRLQAIHELVRRGDYHVPATVIAECMIDRMMTEKRGRGR